MDYKMVMVIDDESDTRVSLFDLLRSEGYLVTTFENPHEALTRVHEIHPDAVILDVRMPQVSGVDFLPDLRLAAPDAAILMLTAFATPELREEAMHRGAADVMSKPFRTRALLDALRGALQTVRRVR
jgi:two-component system response regulator AtoC